MKLKESLAKKNKAALQTAQTGFISKAANLEIEKTGEMDDIEAFGGVVTNIERMLSPKHKERLCRDI